DGQGQHVGIEPSRLLEHRERADPIAQGQRGEERPGPPPAGFGQCACRDDRARDERPRHARAPHLLDERQRVTDGAAAAAQLDRHEEAGPAERGDLLPEIGREAPRVERELLHALGRAALLEQGARRLLEQLLRPREGKIHQARARGSAGRPSARTAMVVRWISEVPPASVWPQLVWYWCSISPRRRAQREPARSTAKGPSSSMPIESTRCPSSSAMTFAAEISPVAGRPR